MHDILVLIASVVISSIFPDYFSGLLEFYVKQLR